MKPSSRGVLLCVTSAIILLPVPSSAEPVRLRYIVELALFHATGAAITTANDQHAASKIGSGFSALGAQLENAVLRGELSATREIADLRIALRVERERGRLPQ